MRTWRSAKLKMEKHSLSSLQTKTVLDLLYLFCDFVSFIVYALLQDNGGIMALTINGKRIGRAAQTDRRDLQEQIEADKQKFSDEFTAYVIVLDTLLGEAEFEKWWDSYPSSYNNKDMLGFMKEKIAELQPHAVEQATALEGEFPSDDLILAWSEGLHPNPELDEMKKDWDMQVTELRNG